MAPSTRNLLIGSSLVVVVGLCTGLVAYYSGALPGGRDRGSELAYIPADVSAVGFADVRSIMDSEFRQKLRQVMPTGTEKDRMFQETGIDIERDIDTAVAGFGNGPDSAVVVLRGRFNQARLEELALSKGAQQQQHAGRTLLVGVAPSSPGNPAPPQGHVPAMAFLADDLLALGAEPAVRKAIDAAVNHDGVTANSELMRFIAVVQGTGNAWLVGRAADITDQPHVPAQIRSQIDGIQWLSLSANIDRDVQARIRAEANDDARAEQMRTMLAGALTALKMFGEQDPRLTAALNSVQTSGTGRAIELNFQVSADLLELLAQRAGVPQPQPQLAPSQP